MAADGVTRASVANLSPGTVATDWQIAAVADMNNNGRKDIIWQNSASGRRLVWFMAADGVTRESLADFTPGTTSTAWQIAAVADMNGNGRNEIIW